MLVVGLLAVAIEFLAVLLIALSGHGSQNEGTANPSCQGATRTSGPIIPHSSLACLTARGWQEWLHLHCNFLTLPQIALWHLLHSSFGGYLCRKVKKHIGEFYGQKSQSFLFLLSSLRLFCFCYLLQRISHH